MIALLRQTVPERTGSRGTVKIWRASPNYGWLTHAQSYERLLVLLSSLVTAQSHGTVRGLRTPGQNTPCRPRHPPRFIL